MELPITITLKTPMQYGNKDVTELVFARELEGTDVRGISVADVRFDDLATVAGRLCGYPSSFIMKLKGADFMAVSKVATDFLSDSPPTGSE